MTYIITAWIMISPYQLEKIDMFFQSMAVCKVVEDSFRIPIPRRSPEDIFWYGNGQGFAWMGCREA